jgi:hypothetical protein
MSNSGSSSETSPASSSNDASSSGVSSLSVQQVKDYGVYEDSGALLKEDDNVFSLIIYASKNSISSHRLSVKDKAGNEVFRFGHSDSLFYCFDGGTFVKKALSSAEAERFVKAHPFAHVIPNDGASYAFVGSKTEPEQSYGSVSVELESGSYFYEFSKQANEFADGIGMGYISSVLELSKAKIRYQKYHDERGWNGYIFYNFLVNSPWNCCDMGLIQMDQTPGAFMPVFNFNGTMSSPSLEHIADFVYDAATDYWCGQEDILFEGWVTTEAYHMRFTTLTKRKVYEFQQANPALASLASQTYLLLAASYCPVTEGTALWNAYCGARYENITFSSIQAAKYRSDAAYIDAAKHAFVPGAADVAYGLLVAPDLATMSHSGNSITVSIIYDKA